MKARSLLAATIAFSLIGGAWPPSSPGRRAAAAPAAARGENGVTAADALGIERAAAFEALARMERRQLRLKGDDRLFADAAAVAWKFVREFQPATGLVAPVRNYSIATIWDIGSMLAAVYCAHELGLLGTAEYQRRAGAMLDTLKRIPLYDQAVFNRAYDTRRGSMMVHRSGAHQVIGWSAVDLGRLLVWLKIIGTQPQFREVTAEIVRRNDLTRVVRDGYLWGLDIDQFAKPFTYQEGRIGYEQYAARGFALWGARADKALSLQENALPVSVMGHELPADRRRWDRLTNEPFLLIGLELGWDGATERLMRRLVRVQEERYARTGLLTLVGEDAIDRPPHYFYYYCVYSHGKAFGIDAQDRESAPDSPRWISAKSAFALHALMPGRYSTQVLERLRGAHGPAGWASGVYEGDGRSTGTPNINTAAVILSAALVHERGEPILPDALRSAR